MKRKSEGRAAEVGECLSGHELIQLLPALHLQSPQAKMAEERSLHEAKLQKMEAEMKMVFQQKVCPFIWPLTVFENP